ncbi:MAG: hypothetical protein RJA25_380 [Bacteroidota bacterium]|jgi:dethiobiotin synthetase
MSKFFITGIDTNIGKTVVSTILAEALKADYWKPIQSGNLKETDSDFVKKYAENVQTVHDETYLLNHPVSPHLAAKIENKYINIKSFTIKNSSNNLIIEGAGGLMVPLSDKSLIKDLIIKLQIPVIVVSKNYLGSINHTLLTIQVLQQFNIPIAGIIFNGDSNKDSEDYILQYSGIRLLGKIPQTDKMSKEFIAEQAKMIYPNLLPLLNEPSENLSL